MRIFALLLPVAVACAQPVSLPRHLVGTEERPLTAPSGLPHRIIADHFIRDGARAAGIPAEDLDGLYVVKEFRTAHNGVSHFVYKQQYLGAEVYGASWVVNVGPDGTVLNAGGSLYRAPGSGVDPPEPVSAMRAVRAAVFSVNPKQGERFAPFAAPGPSRANAVRFHGSSMVNDIDGETVWYPVSGALRPAWRFFVTGDDGTDYEAVVDNETQAVLVRRPMTLYQAPAPPRGLVFEADSPQPNPKPGEPLTSPPPYVQRTLVSFRGDANASPAGWVADGQTSGNNAITGENTPGTNLSTTPKTAASASGDFSFPLEVGPTAPNPINFTDAITTNLFYWVNRAHDQFYRDGFDEPSGNFQKSNFGRGGVDGDALLSYTHYGTAAANSPLLNNSSFSSRSGEDGTPAALRMYLATFPGNFFTDGALDSAVIVHEYTHGVSTRLARDVYTTFQGGAMGEAWSDFFGAEYTLPPNAPADGSYPTGEYFAQAFGAGIRTRPYSTRLDVNPLTFAQLGRVIRQPEVHADGEIWMEALWEVRGALIAQFGDAEGRRRTRLLVIDGMKLSPPAASMVDARDAILLADRVDFKGASQDQLWTAFAKRGLGVLARSPDGNTVHVVASFEKPSPRGAMRFFDSPLVQGEPMTLLLHDANFTDSTLRVTLLTTAGDRETLRMRREGPVYAGTINTTNSAASVTPENGSLQLVPGDTITAYYLDADTGGGAEQITATVATQLPFTVTGARADFKFDNETPLFPTAGQIIATSTNVKLPFAFPFFGKTYSMAQVYTNGAVGFELPVFTPCADRQSFTTFAAAAPLFTELLIGGTAQKDENVYRSQQSPDSITFRWAAETVQAPTPVNFAATLFADGRILFQYGSGNLVQGSAVSAFGCPSAGPQIGVANGHGTFSQAVVIRDLNNGPSVQWTPATNAASAPVIQLETPAANERVRTSVTVSGLAFDWGEAITRIDIFIDGAARGRTSPTVVRSDACGNPAPPGCPRIGFSATLGLAALGLAPGTHTVYVQATNARGAIVAAPFQARPFIVEEGAASTPQLVLERPSPGETLSGSVTVTGYAYDPAYRVTGIDLVVDGFTYGAVTYGAARTDICTPLRNVPNCPNVGFTLALNTISGTILMPNGEHQLQLRVRDETGRALMLPETPIPVTVNNPDRPLPVLVIESPKLNQKISGTFRVSGYAYVPDGRIASVTVSVDGIGASVLGSVVLGDSRPDICGAAPAGTTCPNIGFHLDLDTRVFANGPHSLLVTATTDRGARVSYPSQFAGFNIFVEN